MSYKEILCYIYYIILLANPLAYYCNGLAKKVLWLKILNKVILLSILTELCSIIIQNCAINKYYEAPYHVFQVVEYILLAKIFTIKISNRHVRYFIKKSMIAYPIIMVLSTILYQPLNTYPSYSIMLSYGTITIYCLLVFYEYIINDIDYFGQLFFWLNTLLFLFCSVSFFTLSITNIFKIENSWIYLVHIIINYIFYLGCLSLFIFVKSRTKK